jgi:CRP-like cAMP-binding protein
VSLFQHSRTTRPEGISLGGSAFLPLAASEPRPRREHTVPLTQEFLSEMLGVRRTSVTEVASKMQRIGVISYARGIIKITDLQKLKEISCECYETLRDEVPQ